VTPLAESKKSECLPLAELSASVVAQATTRADKSAEVGSVHRQLEISRTERREITKECST
jgi:hypothetical protein